MMQSLFMEVRPRLQVCNVFLIVKECIIVKDSVKIDVNSSGIEISWETEKSAVIQKINFGNQNWRPMSLSAIQTHKNAVTFRVQTVPVDSSSGSYSLEILPFGSNMNIMKAGTAEKIIPCISTESECLIICKCCSYVISKDNIKFTRVLPLPSSTWSKTDWFCHKHTESSIHHNMSLLPKLDDCFFGSCFVVVNSSLLKLQNNNNVILCKRCIAWLGKNNGDTVQLWNCTVDFGGKSQSTALGDFINVISEAVNESLSMICKLLLYTQLANETFHYILMWVMDKDLEVLLGVDEHCIQNRSTDGQNKHTFILECSLSKHRTIKVLYKYHIECNEMVKLWQNDINIQCIEIAKQMFLSGLDHLVKGMQYLPPAQRIVNNFYASYIGLK